jgi:hypothetical protein
MEDESKGLAYHCGSYVSHLGDPCIVSEVDVTKKGKTLYNVICLQGGLRIFDTNLSLKKINKLIADSEDFARIGFAHVELRG